MKNSIKSALFKLSKDITFRITLIVGAVLAVSMVLIYAAIGLFLDNNSVNLICNGQTFFISSLSPTQNFGLTVPINLIIFTIGEFNCGTIRNKIIAGHKKAEIYLTLFIIGLIFTISLMTLYFGVCVGLSSLIGGFDVNGPVNLGMGTFNPAYLYQYPLMALCVYIFITAFAVFASVLTRNIGMSLPIVIVTTLILYFVGMADGVNQMANSAQTATQVKESALTWINPLQTFGTMSLTNDKWSTTTFIGSLFSPLFWTVVLTIVGITIFKKSDVK